MRGSSVIFLLVGKKGADRRESYSTKREPFALFFTKGGLTTNSVPQSGEHLNMGGKRSPLPWEMATEALHTQPKFPTGGQSQGKTST